MDAMQRFAIEQACTKLMNQFAVYNDQARFAELAALFTENARYARPIAPDTIIDGRSNIQATFEARPKDRVGRHIISNTVIEVQSADRATGICYALLFSGQADKPAAKLGLQAQSPQLVGEFHDEFVLTADGWKFQQRQGRIIFSA